MLNETRIFEIKEKTFGVNLTKNRTNILRPFLMCFLTMIYYVNFI